jgi:hypothetical protein
MIAGHETVRVPGAFTKVASALSDRAPSSGVTL